MKWSRILAAALIFMAIPCAGQGPMTRAFNKEVVDSLSVLLQERTSVKVALKLKNVEKRGSSLDFWFNASLGEVPWHDGDTEWFRKTLKFLYPSAYRGYSVGKVYTNNVPLEDLVTPRLSSDGRPKKTAHLRDNPGRDAPLVSRKGGQFFQKGLSGRHIALWQSHGRYYNDQEDKWKWQRPRLFTTCEDMFTQSFVVPFLMPMLENAGAYVMSPRERDTQTSEAVCDNDPSFEGSRDTVRHSGRYEESGEWEDGGTGFADAKRFYVRNENPFTMGTFRATRSSSASAVWTPDIPEKGRYAVYVAYATVEGSTSAARYIVSHLGGKTEFIVNQTMGGGTWIYLGTFDFDKGSRGSVTLVGPSQAGQVVTADAVRFGGGMGKIAKGPKGDTEENWCTSGMPSYMEGALYSMQWSGMDSTILRGFDKEYTNDFARRGAWVGRLAGGSRANPDEDGLGIPFDLTLAFHSDAGVTPNDSIVGTLALYTSACDGKKNYPGGGSRMAARELCDLVQSQVVEDIRAQHYPQWSRRQVADRSYSECRTPCVPAMILESMSHQNMADMRLGLDPAFRFTVARAVYKGMLKFLANRYGIPYAVQPLPVREFSVTFAAGDIARLCWRWTPDPLEPTAAPTGYILQTRTDDGAFDEGRIIEASVAPDGRLTYETPIPKGHIYSYRIIAYNDGGRSFPSETLAIGSPRKTTGKTAVLVVNNFTRVSGPAWIDTPTYAGLDPKIDAGVPWDEDMTFTGDQYQYRRTKMGSDSELQSDFGASYEDLAGHRQVGNTFDYPYVHGKAIMAAGLAFCSSGSDAFASDSTLTKGIRILDLVCGKQVTTGQGLGAVPDRFRVFPDSLRKAIMSFTECGGNVMVTGSRIGTDIWDMEYPVDVSQTEREEEKQFAKDVLGFSWQTSFAGKSGEVRGERAHGMDISQIRGKMTYCNKPWGAVYMVENPDGIVPATKKDKTFLRYADTGISAGIRHNGKDYKTVVMGFPFESIEDEGNRNRLMNTILDYFGN